MTNHAADEQFTDLEIRIFGRQDEGYPVEITLGGQQEFPRGHLAGDVVPWVPSASPADDGQKLFATFLADPALRSAWAEARARAPRRRIRLRIDPTAAELHALPWEVLQDGPAMLSAQADTPFSRYLPIALPWSGAVEERPIRVLVVIANPDDLATEYDLPPVDVALERETLQAAFEAVGPDELQADYLDAPVTLERLEEALRGASHRPGVLTGGQALGDGYHALHFVGHGAFSARRGQAALYMQDEDGHARRVLDSELVSLVARQSVRPRLVTLVACQSATRSTADAFAGLGPKLVSVGVPAVVAMQDVVAIETARRFEAAFYGRLLEHGYVDRAVNEARSTLLTAGRADAAVPVLFMRLKSGHLWGAEADARGQVLGRQTPHVFWSTLIRNVQRGKCIPIVGPRAYGQWLPGRAEIARALAAEHQYPFVNVEDLARVTQYMATSGGDDFPRYEVLEVLLGRLSQRLPEVLCPGGSCGSLTEWIEAVGWRDLVADHPNEAHQVLAGLDLPLYLTTNPDPFMVAALRARDRQAEREICRWSEDLEWLPSRFEEDATYELGRETPLVYHLFGSDEEPSSLVLTEDHYLNFLVQVSKKEEGWIPASIYEALTLNPLMFVGYSLYDWEFRVLMHGLVASLDLRHRLKHVSVQLEYEDAQGADTAEVQSFLQNYFTEANINVFWGSTAQFIAELRERWDARQR